MAREQRRRLEREDVELMALPPHFWTVRFNQITAQLDGNEGALAAKIRAYFEAGQENRRRGLGLMLVGPNGCGKSCAAAWMGMEYKRLGETVLWVSAIDVLDHKMQGTWYSEDTTYWQWIRDVDVLILDDLGKGDKGSGYHQILWDQLLRHRHDQRRVTIITTNVAEVDEWAGILKRSTLEVLKESVLPLYLHGVNRRDAAVVDIRDRFAAQY